MCQVVNEKKRLSGSCFCIVDIAESPTIATWFRLGKKIPCNGRHFDVFIDQRSSDRRAGRQENGSDDFVFCFHKFTSKLDDRV